MRTKSRQHLQSKHFESDFKMDNFSLFRRIKNHSSSLSDQDSFQLLRYIYGWEIRHKVLNSRIPFDGVLRSHSKHYRNLIRIGKSFGIKTNLKLQATYSAFERWQPFSDSISIQPIQAELIFLQGLKPDPFVIRDSLNLIRLNRNYQHELLHSILFRLVPYSSGIQAKDYFLFIEALVFALERYTSADLGAFLTTYFCHFGALDRKFNERTGMNSKQIFKASFVSFLMCLHEKDSERNIQRLRKRGLYIKSKSVFVPKKFIKIHSKEWLDQIQKQEYPKRWSRLGALYPRFNCKDFSFQYLIRESNLEALSEWCDSVFELGLGL